MKFNHILELRQIAILKEIIQPLQQAGLIIEYLKGNEESINLLGFIQLLENELGIKSSRNY